MATLALVGAALCATGPAGAADQRSAALAESLFREAKRLVSAGDYDEACPKFAESHRLDPQLGTLLHLATCHEQQGKTASAWAEFGEAAEWAAKESDSRREKLARGRMTAIEPKLAHLMVELGAHQEGLQLTLDGSPLGLASLATPLPVDPGEHVLEAKVPGAEAWSHQVTVTKPGEVVEVSVPKLAGKAPAGDSDAVGDSDGSASTPGQAIRISGWVIGGVGLAGMVVMAVFGARASSQASDADELCSGSYCTEEGLDGWDDAYTSADIATAAFVVGAVCLATGLTLVLAAPSSDDEGNEQTETALRVEASVQPLLGRPAAGPVGATLQLGFSW